MSIETLVKEYVARNFIFSDNGFPYSDDASFLEEGIVDSIGVMELVAFVEEQFSVRVDDLDVTPENFDSINRLAAYIRHKTA